MTIGKINWSNPEERKKFEDELEVHVARRSKWSVWEKFVWAFEIFFVNLIIISILYGSCAYYIVTDAMALKKSEEELMEKNWLEQNSGNQVCKDCFHPLVTTHKSIKISNVT